MALQSSNKLRVFAENSSSQSPTTTLSDENYNADVERTSGSKPNTVVRSQLINTALKEATLCATALVDALKQLSGDTTEIGINTDVDVLATMMVNALKSATYVSGLLAAGKNMQISGNTINNLLVGGTDISVNDEDHTINSLLEGDNDIMSIAEHKIKHKAVIGSAGNVGPTSSSSGWGASIRVPYISYDKYGHIKSTNYWSIACPSLPSTSYKDSSSSVRSGAHRTLWTGQASSAGTYNLSLGVSNDFAQVWICVKNSNNEYSWFALPTYYILANKDFLFYVANSTSGKSKYVTFWMTTSTFEIKSSEDLAVISITQNKEVVVA